MPHWCCMKYVCVLPCWGPHGAHPSGTAAAPGSLAAQSQQTDHWSCLWWPWSPADWCTCTDRPTGPSWSHQTPPPPPLYGPVCCTWQRTRAEGEMSNTCRCLILYGKYFHLAGPWPVDVLHVVIVVEVLSHGRSVTQTLQDGVHVARVAQVAKASQWWTQTPKWRIQVANFGSWWPYNLHFRVDFTRRSKRQEHNECTRLKEMHCAISPNG